MSVLICGKAAALAVKLEKLEHTSDSHPRMLDARTQFAIYSQAVNFVAWYYLNCD